MSKPAKNKAAAKVNTIEALKVKAAELARQAEDADESLRECAVTERLELLLRHPRQARP